MDLAINYSAPSAQLVKSGKINVDYFKTPDWDWMVKEAEKLRPVAVHFNLEIGNGLLSLVDWNGVEQFLKTTGTPYINAHLDPKQKYYTDLAVDTVNAGDIERVYEVILEDIKILIERYGVEKIIIENSPYRGKAGGTLRLCVEPSVINHLIAETGCGFLLDISHAVLASHYIGMHPSEYFSLLPTQRIKEMHFAGIHKINGELVDHLSVKKKDWGWLDWVLGKIQCGEWSTPWLLAFEYGGVGEVFEWRTDPEVMIEQVPKLWERVGNFNAKSSVMNRQDIAG